MTVNLLCSERLPTCAAYNFSSRPCYLPLSTLASVPSNRRPFWLLSNSAFLKPAERLSDNKPSTLIPQGRGATRRLAAGSIPMTVTIVPEWYTDTTLYSDVPQEEVLGPKGSRETFINVQKLKLASYFFPAAGTPRALAILVHGHGCSLPHEYLHSKEPGKAGIYEGSIVEKLNQAGFAAAGIDLQGCGHSEGVRCYVDRYRDYVEEVLDFTRYLDEEKHPGFSGLPKFVIGVSLGGCISVDACKSSNLFKGAVLLAPMLSLERVSKSGLNPYLRHVAGIISWLFPQLEIAKTERNILYPDIQAFFDRDPQVWHGWTRARNAQEYLMCTEALCASMGSVTFPFICFHGDDDTMTDPEGSKRLYEQAQSADKELVIIPKRWHVLLKEPGCQELGLKVVQWISQRI